MNQSSPIRILHFVGGMNRGGAETFIMNLFRNIDRSKIQFDFIVQTDQICHYDNEIEKLGGRIFRLARPFPSISGLYDYSQELKKILSHIGQVHGIHSHVNYFSGINLFIAKEMGVGLRIAHSHSTLDGKGASVKRKAYLWVMRQSILRNSTFLIGCSQDACGVLYGQRLGLDKRVMVVPNAINVEDYNMNNSGKTKLIYELELPKNAQIIGHIGRFCIPKNHTFIIEIFVGLLQRIPEGHLVLVGEGPLIDQIKALVDEKGIADHVHFLGIRNDVAELLAAFDAILFPSLYEGLPVALIEAQASGVSCVISDSITREVDMGLGLINFINLKANLSEWVDTLALSMSRPRPLFSDRKMMLEKKGYDIRNIVDVMEKIYEFGI